MKKSEIFLLKASIIVGFGGFIFGYDLGVITGSLKELIDSYNLNSSQAGLVVSLLPLGSALGCLFGGILCDKIGRWWTIHIQNIAFIIGSIILSFSTNILHLYIGRFIIGIAASLSAIADIPYLTEISPLSYRGRISSSFEILVVIGILVSFILALILTYFNVSWRILYGLPVIFALLQSFGMLFLPESPQWLIQNNKQIQARNILEEIFESNEELEESYNEILLNCTSQFDGITLHSKIIFKQYSIPIIVTIVLIFFQQFTGGIVIRNYSLEIFLQAGYSNVIGLILTVILGFVKVFVTIWAVYHIDSMGRKPLLLLGVKVMAVGMSLLTILFASSSTTSLSSSSNSISILFLITYILALSLVTCGYSLSFGPVLWLLQSELFPIVIRSRIMSFTVLINNVLQFIFNYLYLPIIESLGKYSYLIYAGYFISNILCYYYITYFTIETNNLNNNEILKQYYELYYQLYYSMRDILYGENGNNRYNNRYNNNLNNGNNGNNGNNNNSKVQFVVINNIPNVLDDDINDESVINNDLLLLSSTTPISPSISSNLIKILTKKIKSKNGERNERDEGNIKLEEKEKEEKDKKEKEACQGIEKEFKIKKENYITKLMTKGMYQELEIQDDEEDEKEKEYEMKVSFNSNNVSHNGSDYENINEEKSRDSFV